MNWFTFGIFRFIGGWTSRHQMVQARCQSLGWDFFRQILQGYTPKKEMVVSYSRGTPSFHFRWGFSMKESIQRAWGIPMTLETSNRASCEIFGASRSPASRWKIGSWGWGTSEFPTRPPGNLAPKWFLVMNMGYTLEIQQFASETAGLWLIYLWKVVIFHGELLVNQRVFPLLDSMSSMSRRFDMAGRHGDTPSSLDGLFQGKSQSEMDENWGYSYFRKPPYMFLLGFSDC